MKIEKVNDTQIRCTLTKEDLADRELKLSELAYGSEKAKSLFREMMQQAAYEFGFEADNIPLMIEAIPLSSEAIILIITKVEYPEELDSRFSQFSPPSVDDISEEYNESAPPLLEGAEEIINLIRDLHNKAVSGNTQESAVQGKLDDLMKKPLGESIGASLEKLLSSIEGRAQKAPQSSSEEENQDVAKLMIFNHLDEVSQVASMIGDFYKGKNDLYLNKKEQNYYLILHRSNHTPEEFNRVCNTLSEYAKQGTYTGAMEAYFKEHNACILSEQALQTLNSL